MSHESAPLISIFIAVFSGKATLQQCIDSVAQQTYPNKELIIVDDGSKDGSVELLERNREKASYWISALYRSIYKKWNEVLAQVRNVLQQRRQAFAEKYQDIVLCMGCGGFP
jgi:glycosyltransferase involved in cell wall biosynthesis